VKRRHKYILFLNNRYRSRDDAFYLNLLRGRCPVAVDGGIKFFYRNRITPDILIGDMDSMPQLPRRYLERIEIIKYPSIKNKTDSQLALEMALARGAREILICGAVGGREIDHVMGNIMLLHIVNKYNQTGKAQVQAKITGPCETVFLVENGTIHINGRRGDFVSVIPLEDGVRVACGGMEYKTPARPLKFGDTLTLRNRLAKSRAWIKIDGSAILTAIAVSYPET